MLKIKLDRDVLTKAIEYHADNDEGLTIVIEDDADLEDWTRRTLAKVSGFDLTAISEEAGLVVNVLADGILISVLANKAGEDVLEAVRHYIL